MENSIRLHVFYGIPCTGKSTTAIRFAYESNIRTVISTDYIREVQRTFVEADRNSALMHVTHTAWQMYGDATTESIRKGYIDHADSLLPSLMAVCSKLTRDGFSAVIEGAHFYSDIFEKLQAIPNLCIVPQLLVVSDKEQLLKHINSKQQARRVHKEQKKWEEHLEIIMSIQDFLIRDAETHKIPINRVKRGV